MDTKPTDMAFPLFDTFSGATATGLTKREYFAAMADSKGFEFGDAKSGAKFLGLDAPDENDVLGMVELACKIEAKIKVIKADALIETLNKQ